MKFKLEILSGFDKFFNNQKKTVKVGILAAGGVAVGTTVVLVAPASSLAVAAGVSALSLKGAYNEYKHKKQQENSSIDERFESECQIAIKEADVLDQIGCDENCNQVKIMGQNERRAPQEQEK
ncbi:unnamed protein product [Brachionus calyciflorus]|uniref:Uncharacterized protein n=1 Tax=Brachionus calyciflorus TaxID=104777 RepID=A0A813MJA7_9BILA|nr:unnamed protein product [Brachionus calyciflorus]